MREFGYFGKGEDAEVVPFDLEEAVDLHDNQGWGWVRLAKRYGRSEVWTAEHIQPYCQTETFPAGLTEEEVREVYRRYAENPNITALAEETGKSRHVWRMAFLRLGLPMLQPVRRHRGLYTAVEAPRCARCGILLEEVRHRQGYCVECLLEMGGRRDVALEVRGYLLTKGELPPMPEADVDALLAHVGVRLDEIAQGSEERELVLEMA